MNPYRSKDDGHAHARHAHSVRELILPFAMLWIVSMLRVLTALLGHRTFGAVDTLAAFAVILLPWVLLRGRLRVR